MKKYYPSKNSLYILKVILLLLTIFFFFFVKVYLSAYPILMFTAIILFCALFVIIGAFWLPLYFSKTVYYISDFEISKQSGVLFEKKQLMKVKSVQYYTRLLTPLSKFTGFNFLKMNALGGSILLWFLNKDDANEIADTLALAIRARDE
mgnify:CR=1 FL=1